MKAADDASAELKPFLAHLEDFRQMLLRCALALGIGMSVVIPFVPRILAVLKRPLGDLVADPDAFLRTMEVSGAFTAMLQMAFWCGLVVSSPFLLLFIGQFILPALTRREQRLVYRASGAAVLLFVGGVGLGYFFTLPFALKAMFAMNTWMGIRAEWTLTSYVAFSTQLLIAFGLAFELPMVLLALGRLGVLTSAQLAGRRRHAVVAILVIGAVLTPPDMVSQLILSIPLYLLFEMCIAIIRSWERRRAGTVAPCPPATRT